MPSLAGADERRIYCAGPLFNPSERDEMTRIADTLVAAGFSVYLPHRDGMEFRLVHAELIERGWEAAAAGRFLHEAIFALDVYQLVEECAAVVWNLNGRVPDEGAVAEAAIAWTLGKPVVAFHNDVRSLIAGRINPLLAGLVDFETVADFAGIPARLSAALETAPRRQPAPLPEKLIRAVRDGRTLWQRLGSADAATENDLIAETVADLFAPNAVRGG